MTLVAIALFCFAFLFSLTGGIMLLVAAFRQHLGWGLASLFIPGAQLIFIILHWAEAKKGFLVSLLGGFFMVGSVTAALKSPEGELLAKWGKARSEEPAGPSLEDVLIAKETELRETEAAANALQAKLEKDYANLSARRQSLNGDPAATSAFNELAAIYQQEKTHLTEQLAKVEELRKEAAELTQKVFEHARNLAANQAKAGEVVMYTTKRCPACVAAKQYLKGKGISYREIDVNSSREGYEEFRKLGGTGVPLILVNGDKIHGFDRARLDAML